MVRNILVMAAIAVATAGNVGFSHDVEVRPSGIDGQRSFDVGGFDRVKLSGPFNVQVVVGGGAAARAEGDTGLMDAMEVLTEDGSLVIRQRDGHRWSSTGDRRVTVYVSAPALAGAEVAGSGDIRVSAVRGRSFDASIAGSGSLRLARLDVQSARFAVAGSGDVEAMGAARDADIQIAGSGDVRLAGLQTESARVSIAGSGNADIHARASARVDVVGSGDVTVRGGARCDVSRMGSGSVRCGG